MTGPVLLLLLLAICFSSLFMGHEIGWHRANRPFGWRVINGKRVRRKAEIVVLDDAVKARERKPKERAAWLSIIDTPPDDSTPGAS